MAMWLTDPATQRLARADRYGYSVLALERFFAAERDAGRIGGRITVADLDDPLIDRFIEHRKAQGVVGETIWGDLYALRRSLNWALKKRYLKAVPYVKDVDREDRSPPREIEYDFDQVAGILEAAARLPERHHVRLFTMIMLSTHTRVEALLEYHSRQTQKVQVAGEGERWIFNFLAQGRRQTTKRRMKVIVCSVLRPWLADIEGKLIMYKAAIAERKWRDPMVPEFYTRPCYDIGNAFEACVVEAGLADPSLQLVEPKLGPDGSQLVALNKRTGQEVPQWRGIGTPNTLRHTCHTYHQAAGTPQGQIDAASGHYEPGSGRNYSHLRPEYLKEFMAATDAYWEEIGKRTKVHLRDHVPAVVVDFGKRRG